jgi:hypothetical protein
MQFGLTVLVRNYREKSMLDYCQRYFKGKQKRSGATKNKKLPGTAIGYLCEHTNMYHNITDTEWIDIRRCLK